jgi:predicted nucleic acid-binding protein
MGSCTENNVRVFIDTWGWVTSSNKREARHREVSAFLKNFWDQGGMSYTSDYVLDETITLLFCWMSFETAKAGMETIETAIKRGYLRLVHLQVLILG